MSKKSMLSKGIEGLLQGNQEIIEKEDTIEKPIPQESILTEKVNLEIKTTQLVKIDTLEKIKNIAYWERSKIKDIFEEAFQDYIKKYESLNGEIKSRK
ncbi:hypothetical protein [Empedobacter sp.]|uniref:hypothetical protein n=1 Tax=Empedobacter sp. TaxID=1927715 RepID=UPI0028A7B3EE|nr:hypothetical protein [Empedobacter sp.]